MDDFARRSAGDRRAFIGEAAARRELTAIVIEKDFWVCWILRRLMRCKALEGQMTFKGGTSLSKAYGVIDRFSEDIDLTIARCAPSIADVASPMDKDISNNERQRRTRALKEAAQAYVAKVAMPALAGEIEAALGTSEGWTLKLDPDDADRQSLLFHYPQTTGYGLDWGNDHGGERSGYITSRIKLEFGARGETDPNETRAIRPYLADDFPDQVPDAVTDVPTLAVERTFWEKVTILHALANNGKIRDGMSRHYFDTLMLHRAGVTTRALETPDLLESVVRNKSLMFPDKSASYDTATIGTIRLLPDGEGREVLKRDYEAMRDMFMNEPPTIGDVLEGLVAVEATLNTPR
jgi:hypothetical protein